MRNLCLTETNTQEKGGYMVNTGALLIVAVYLVGMLLVGFVVGKLKIKDSEDYMVAGRRMGIFMVAFSLSANNIGGGSTTGLAQKAFEDWGMSAIWYVLAASIAMIPLAYFAPRIRKTMAVTIPEVVERRFGKGSATFSAVLNILALFCLTSSQVAASGGVIATLTGIPLNVCLFLAGLVIIIYTTLGGMIADQISDLIQFIIILAGLAIATPFVIHGCGGWEAVSAALPGEQLSFWCAHGCDGCIPDTPRPLRTCCEGPNPGSHPGNSNDECHRALRSDNHHRTCLCRNHQCDNVEC